LSFDFNSESGTRRELKLHPHRRFYAGASIHAQRRDVLAMQLATGEIIAQIVSGWPAIPQMISVSTLAVRAVVAELPTRASDPS
jgi:hypothetical protein